MLYLVCTMTLTEKGETVYGSQTVYGDPINTPADFEDFKNKLTERMGVPPDKYVITSMSKLSYE